MTERTEYDQARRLACDDDPRCGGRITVLHVAQPTTAGVPNAVLPMLREQVARGWQVHLACPSDGFLAYQAQSLGVTVHEWKASRNPGRQVPRELARLRKILTAVGPDLVHAHSSKAGLIVRALVRGRIPTVFQPHAWSFHAVSGAIRRATLFWERWATRWTSAIIAVSDDERAEGLQERIDSSYIVIPNGVDLERFALTDQKAMRAALKVPDAPTVVCVGRLCEQKGQDRLLQAWVAVERAVPEARLVLVGDGPDRPTVEEMVASLNLRNVELVGDQADVRPWLYVATVTVFPSRWEAGLSLAVMEAMAAGRSVVATEFEGAATALRSSAGAVVAHEDTESLTRELIRRLQDEDLSATEGRNGREIIAEKFAQSELVQRVSDFYLDILHKSTATTDPPPASTT